MWNDLMIMTIIVGSKCDDYDYFSSSILFNNITYCNCKPLFTKVVYKRLAWCKYITTLRSLVIMIIIVRKK